MKESTIRQVITGIIHGGQEITKESTGYAAGKGVEIMEFLKENNLLYGNFIPDTKKVEKIGRVLIHPETVEDFRRINAEFDRNYSKEREITCMTCGGRHNFDDNVEIKEKKLL